jgi:hypothetical protein
MYVVPRPAHHDRSYPALARLRHCLRDGHRPDLSSTSLAAMIADVVPPYHLTNAIGLTSIVFNMACSTGPALAGFLSPRSARRAAMSSRRVLSGGDRLDPAACLTRALPAACVVAPHTASPSARASSKGGGLVGATRRCAPDSRHAVRPLFIVPFTTLLPVFARDILGVGATGQGAPDGHGYGRAVQRRPPGVPRGPAPTGLLMLWGVTVYGLSVVAFGLASSVPAVAGTQ